MYEIAPPTHEYTEEAVFGDDAMRGATFEAPGELRLSLVDLLKASGDSAASSALQAKSGMRLGYVPSSRITTEQVSEPTDAKDMARI